MSEGVSVVWTQEMAESFGLARKLLNNGDEVAARMAFKEHYTMLVANARSAMRRPRAPHRGFPAMTEHVAFLIKDFVLFAASFYLLKEDVIRAALVDEPAL